MRTCAPNEGRVHGRTRPRAAKASGSGGISVGPNRDVSGRGGTRTDRAAVAGVPLKFSPPPRR